MKKCPQCGNNSLGTETEILPNGLRLRLKCVLTTCGYSKDVPHGQELQYLKQGTPLYESWQEYLGKNHL